MEPYQYRRSTPLEQDELRDERRARGYPLHSPPHLEGTTKRYLLTAACFEHAAFLNSATRRTEFEGKVLDFLASLAQTRIFAWCVLPNHYHVVVEGDLLEMGKKLHRLHNGTSTGWNREDDEAGRKIWYRHFSRQLRTERLFYVALNYVHTNAAKHGYVKKPEDWPTCSVGQHLETVGRAEARRLLLEYPILGFGDGWDD